MEQVRVGEARRHNAYHQLILSTLL